MKLVHKNHAAEAAAVAVVVDSAAAVAATDAAEAAAVVVASAAVAAAVAVADSAAATAAAEEATDTSLFTLAFPKLAGHDDLKPHHALCFFDKQIQSNFSIQTPEYLQIRLKHCVLNPDI